jgi:hypothetical protein
LIGCVAGEKRILVEKRIDLLCAISSMAKLCPPTTVGADVPP